MSLKDWLTKNLYVTAPSDPDPFFHPRRYSKSKAEVAQALTETARSLPRWKVVEYRENQGRLHLTRSDLFLPFAQDVNAYVVQGSDGLTRLEMTSQSQGGKGDFGRNKRNLKEFLSRLDRLLPPL